MQLLKILCSHNLPDLNFISWFILEPKGELLELEKKFWGLEVCLFVVILQVRIFNRNTFLKGSHVSFRFGKELVLLSDLTIT